MDYLNKKILLIFQFNFSPLSNLAYQHPVISLHSLQRNNFFPSYISPWYSFRIICNLFHNSLPRRSHLVCITGRLYFRLHPFDDLENLFHPHGVHDVTGISKRCYFIIVLQKRGRRAASFSMHASKSP